MVGGIGRVGQLVGRVGQSAPALEAGGGAPSWMPLNRRVGFLGDSFTVSTGATNAVYGYARQALEWAGTLHHPPSLRVLAGVAGNTSAQMLARAATDLPPSSIDVLVLLAGTNDSADVNAVSASAYGANLTAICALYPNVQKVIVTPAPRRSPSNGERQRLIDYRAWIIANADALGAKVADAYPLLSDGSDTLLASCSSDGVHVNNLGHSRIASVVGAQLMAWQAPRTSMAEALSANNLITNGLMAGSIGAGDPTGWSSGVPGAQTAGTAAVRSIVSAPEGGAGQAYRLDITAAADSRVRRRQTLTAFAEGDRLLFIGRVTVSDISGDWETTNAALTANSLFRISNTSSGADLSTSPVGCASLDRQMAQTYTVAAGTTSISFQTVMVLPNGAHYQADFHEFAAFNLTALGLANSILV